MTLLFKKLNLKDVHTEITILNAPESFRLEMELLGDAVHITESLKENSTFSFLMAFVTQQQEVNELSKLIAQTAGDDAVIWFCYPKGSSRKYKCNFNRDTGWANLGEAGFEPVRMVAIDADWSALRFRRVQHIKTMTRSSALLAAGKERIEMKKGI